MDYRRLLQTSALAAISPAHLDTNNNLAAAEFSIQTAV